MQPLNTFDTTSMPRRQTAHRDTTRRAVAWFTLLCFTFQPFASLAAGVVADTGAAASRRPLVDTTANGLPLVQITTPSAAGVSHNQYNQYNVDSRGVILNNARTITQTQQGGFVDGNPNLSGAAARVILNEVTSRNPSLLQGYTEVAGSRAEVVIANPNGITCNGCGFINTSRGVLTTGTPVFGGSGSLDAFRVVGGSISIGSQGLNATNTDQLDLITRSVAVNGQLWAKQLNVITGTNQVNYNTLGTQTIDGDPSETVPAVSIDVALLGGMYANKIRLVGTEAGVGVASLGTIAAQGGDLTLDTKGRITLNGNTNATGNISINTQDSVTNTATLYGQGNVSINAGLGVNNSNIVAAGNNLSINAASLNSHGILASGLNPDGSIGNQGNLTVATTGSIAALGQNLAGGNLNLTGSSIDLSSTQTSANGNVTLIANNGNITHRNSTLDAGGSVLINSTGTLDNRQGTIEAASGVTASNGQLVINVRDIDNSAGRIVNNGSGLTTLQASNSIINNNSGQQANQGVIGGNGDVSITTNTLINTQSANIFAGNDLAFDIATQLDNTLSTLHAGHDLSILQPTSVILNTGGSILAEHNIDLHINTFNGVGEVLAGNDATLVLDHLALAQTHDRIKANHDLNLTTRGDLINQASLEAVNKLTLNVDHLVNNKQISGGSALDIHASNLDNSLTGSITATENTIDIANILTNRGVIDGEQTVINAATINNIGTGQLYGNILAIQSTHLQNDTETVNGIPYAATIAARERLDIGVDSLTNREHAFIFSAGTGADALNIGGALDSNHNAIGLATLVNNNSATIESNGGLSIAADTLNNTNEHFTSRLALSSQVDFFEISAGRWCSAYYAQSGCSGNYIEDHTEHTYSRLVYDSVVDQSDPGRITASGSILFTGNLLTNDKSQIIAGNALSGDFNRLNNIGAAGIQQHTLIDRFRVYQRFEGYIAAGTNTITDSTATTLSVSQVIANTAPQSSTLQLAALTNTVTQSNNSFNANALSGNTANQSLTLPTSSLYRIQPAPGQQYLVETNPRFANYSNFISSDYLLSRLAFNPQRVQKRLGDGFYEQQLVLDQIAQLTGRRFLSGNTDGQQQFQALLESGVAAANAFDLTPGIALTDAQIASLTHDIVWLEEETVTLPDGSSTVVLAPRVYLTRLHTDDLKPSGAVIAANEIDLVAHDTLTNSGTIQSTGRTRLAANDINNLAGTIKSDGALELNAGNDINNVSGNITGKSVSLTAERDINNSTAIENRSTGSDVRSAANGILSFNIKNPTLGQRGSISSTDGDLAINAGRNLTNTAANISATGNAALSAGQNIQIGTEAVGNRRGVLFSTTQLTSSLNTGGNLTLQSGADTHLTSAQINTGNHLTVIAGGNLTIDAAKNVDKTDDDVREGKGHRVLHSVDETVVSSEIKAGGNVTLAAVASVPPSPPSGGGAGGEGNPSTGLRTGDVSIAAANISTDSGSLSIVADGNVDLTVAHENDSSYREQYSKKKGFLSSKSKLNIDQSQSDTAVGNTLSADSISIQAGRDLSATGASVVATNEVSLSAARDVTIRSAESTASESHVSQTKKSGVFGSGGLGITVGSQKLNSNTAQQTTTQTASVVGSLTGDVNITAGNDAHITASDLIAGQDINVTGRNVTLDAANDTIAQQSETKFKQSGLSISLNAPVIQTAQAATAAAERATEVRDPRLQAAFALRAAQNAVKTVDAAQGIIQSGDPTSAFNLSVTIGSSQSQSSSSRAESTAKGSSLTAGRDVNLVATGDAASGNGDVNLIGTTAQAARDINLAANRDVNLLSAANQSNSQSSNKSSSASLGVALSVTGPSLIANASSGKGNSNGADLTHTETTLKAGDTLSLDAGRDATLKGAVANGNTVIADVGRNLTLQSEQDSSTYTARQKSAGVGLSVGLDGKVGGNVSVGKSKTDSSYQSVIEQTAINAGSGGFDINVNGNTHLGGAIVNSTAPAENNQLTTGTLTTENIENRGQYSASSANVGLNVGGSLATGTDQPAGGSKGGSGLDAGLGGMAVADSGDASGTTKAAISAATITITDQAKQTELTGTTAAETVAQLNRDTANANGSIQNPFNLQEVQEQLEFLQVLGEDVVKPVAASAAKWIGDQFPPDPNDPTRIDPAKVAAHAALGAAISTLLGTGWESGAAAGALGDVLPGLLTKAFETDPATGKPKNEEAFKAANAIIAALLASAAGADAAQIINAGVIAKNAVENNYLKHTEIQALAQDWQKCTTTQCKNDLIQKYRAISDQHDRELRACSSFDCVAGHLASIHEADSALASLYEIDATGQLGFTVNNWQRTAQTSIAPITAYQKHLISSRKDSLVLYVNQFCRGLDASQCATQLLQNKATAKALGELAYMAAMLTPAGVADDAKTLATGTGLNGEDSSRFLALLGVLTAGEGTAIKKALEASGDLITLAKTAIKDSPDAVKLTQELEDANQQFARQRLLDNIARGQAFEDAVRDYFNLTGGKTALTVPLNGKEVVVIPDGLIKEAGIADKILEVKDVISLSNSNQFRAYLESGKPIELVVSTRNQKIYKPLQELIKKSGGSIKVFDPATGQLTKWEP